MKLKRYTLRIGRDFVCHVNGEYRLRDLHTTQAIPHYFRHVEESYTLAMMGHLLNMAPKDFTKENVILDV